MNAQLSQLGAAALALAIASTAAAQTPGDNSIDPRLTQPVRPGTVQRDLPPIRQPTLSVQVAGEAPRWLRVTATTSRSVSLAWTPTTGSAGYWVHQADTTGKYYRGGALVTDTMTTVSALQPGTRYSFKVSAVYPPEAQRGEGFSEAVSATTALVKVRPRY